MKKNTQPPVIEDDKPAFRTLKPKDTRLAIWEGFTALSKKVKAALNDTYQSEGVSFFASANSDTELSFEINYGHRLDMKKNLKGISTAPEPEPDKPLLMGVHWLVVTPIKDATIVRVTRTETSQKLGEVSGMGRGTRTSAVFTHDEQKMALPVAELIEEFEGAVGKVASERLKARLIKAQIVQPA